MVLPAAVVDVHVTIGAPPTIAIDGLDALAPDSVKPPPVTLPPTPTQVPLTSWAT